MDTTNDTMDVGATLIKFRIASRVRVSGVRAGGAVGVECGESAGDGDGRGTYGASIYIRVLLS